MYWGVKIRTVFWMVMMVLNVLNIISTDSKFFAALGGAAFTLCFINFIWSMIRTDEDE